MGFEMRACVCGWAAEHHGPAARVGAIQSIRSGYQIRFRGLQGVCEHLKRSAHPDTIFFFSGLEKKNIYIPSRQCKTFTKAASPRGTYTLYLSA